MVRDLAKRYEATIWESDDVIFRGYLEDQNGNQVYPAMLSGYSVYVYAADGDAGDDPIPAYTIAGDPVLNVVFDDPVPWGEDDKGYNWEVGIEYAGGLEGGRSYDVEIFFHILGGGSIKSISRLNIRNLRSI